MSDHPARGDSSDGLSADAARLGATPAEGGTHFAVWSNAAERIELCLFDGDGAREMRRITLDRGANDVHRAFVPGIAPGARYGLRAHGRWAPHSGHRFDPAKLLLDPYARAIDRPYAYDPRLAERGFDTAALVPKGIVTTLPPPVAPAPPRFGAGGLIYELQVRAFTMLHPDVPKAMRGTVGALAHPAVIAHLKRIGVDAVELMPITAWIDERHLPPLGLTNGWGYNPVSWFALDPRLAPGGMTELRDAVAALRAAEIGVILDVVYNHMGESDTFGPTLSLRGLDEAAYYAHGPDGALVNDTGCGNSIACNHPAARCLILDAMRHFVVHAGVDGFRFDLAPLLGRGPEGFDPNSELISAILADPLLSDRILIAEPWDIGPGGYQLGHFPPPLLEWNDRYRDDVRRFWRGDPHSIGDIATRLAGSSDIFARSGAGITRSVNFIAAHDGFTLADLVSYEYKHNEANGEENRDGHDANHSWNSGAEGPSADPVIAAARAADLCALLGTLFASRGTIMLTAGDEFGRTQRGNNNAYAQDNAITWLDWAGRDEALIEAVTELSALRRRWPILGESALLTGETDGEAIPDVAWLTPAGAPFTEADWHAPDQSTIAMLIRAHNGLRLAILINRSVAAVDFRLPQRDGYNWQGATLAPPRSVSFVEESAQR